MVKCTTELLSARLSVVGDNSSSIPVGDMIFVYRKLVMHLANQKQHEKKILIITIVSVDILHRAVQSAGEIHFIISVSGTFYCRWFRPGLVLVVILSLFIVWEWDFDCVLLYDKLS